MISSRRGFLAGASASVAFAGLARFAQAQAQALAPSYANEVFGYGALARDPAGVLDLPQGFAYRIISTAGQEMSDGLLTPHLPDGMGCFAAGRGRVVLLRNHEVRADNLGLGAFGPRMERAGKVDRSRVYDRAKTGELLPGGVTRLTYDLRSGKLIDHHLALAGGLVNCAGGITPRGSWLTCEEVVATPTAEKSHGWVFEVPADGRGLADPVPLTGMGRFVHEATCTDPRTGIVYLTEDQQDGLFYRFLPNDREDLRKGGRLQAMGFANGMGDSRNWTAAGWRPGEKLETRWIDLDGVDNPNNDLKQRGHARGAALFARGEGVWFGERELYFTCTSGGPGRQGQVIRYVPSADEGRSDAAPGTAQLFVESANSALMHMPDNITVAPWGHLLVCEDRSGEETNHVRGVTPEGKLYTVARNAKSSSEFAGACFSPDGSTLFLNLQEDGLTVAVTGPWRRLRT